MPKAPAPAARAALDTAGLDWDDLEAITAHNPFAVKDVWFAEQTGIDVERMKRLRFLADLRPPSGASWGA